MQIAGIPFGVTDWAAVAPTTRKGDGGLTPGSSDRMADGAAPPIIG